MIALGARVQTVHPGGRVGRARTTPRVAGPLRPGAWRAWVASAASRLYDVTPPAHHAVEPQRRAPRRAGATSRRLRVVVAAHELTVRSV